MRDKLRGVAELVEPTCRRAAIWLTLITQIWRIRRLPYRLREVGFMTVAHARPVRFMHHDASERPFIVIWEVTRACQLVCTHCRADAIRARNPFELTTDEGCRMLDDLASFGTPRPLVVLTGGDPFERPDLPELVSHGTRIGLSMALSPSVTDRLTRSVLVELHEAGAKAISLSLDGATTETHDSFRGVEGVFDATLDAAHTVRDVGLRLQINTTVTSGNVHELPRMLLHVLDLDAALWSVFFLLPRSEGKRSCTGCMTTQISSPSRPPRPPLPADRHTASGC